MVHCFECFEKSTRLINPDDNYFDGIWLKISFFIIIYPESTHIRPHAIFDALQIPFVVNVADGWIMDPVSVLRLQWKTPLPLFLKYTKCIILQYNAFFFFLIRWILKRRNATRPASYSADAFTQHLELWNAILKGYRRTRLDIVIFLGEQLVFKFGVIYFQI